jgi:hypothetical protein
MNYPAFTFNDCKYLIIKYKYIMILINTKQGLLKILEKNIREISYS